VFVFLFDHKNKFFFEQE